MTKEKVFRVVETDADNDGENDDITIMQGERRIVTVYDWKSVVLSWIATTTALFVAGMGVISFGM